MHFDAKKVPGFGPSSIATHNIFGSEDFLFTIGVPQSCLYITLIIVLLQPLQRYSILNGSAASFQFLFQNAFRFVLRKECNKRIICVTPLRVICEARIFWRINRVRRSVVLHFVHPNRKTTTVKIHRVMP